MLRYVEILLNYATNKDFYLSRHLSQILLCDEPTSSLDTATEYEVMRELKGKQLGGTYYVQLILINDLNNTYYHVR
jgi:ABC-type cobalamin/Fe3+-siderophores transport system ATPase subunit